jgi:hypothetical protein
LTNQGDPRTQALGNDLVDLGQISSHQSQG